MVWLNASLAFTLVMIILCTMVTAVTEAIHHCFTMRQRGLKRMLQQLFDQAIWPRVELSLADRKDTLKNNFLEILTRNPAVEGQRDGKLWSLRTWFAPRELDSLTLTQLAEGLADTEVGKQIWSSGRTYATQVVDDMARRFQRFEEGATAYFAQRAQMLSLVVAILLAFILNVDAIRLFSTFLTDHELTAQVLAQESNIIAAYHQQQEKMAATRTGQPAAAGSLAATMADQERSDNATLQALKESIAFLRQQLTASKALGLPIGTAYYPWGKSAETNFVQWLLSVLLTGFLIGLGGPFWFNAYSNLSAFIQLLRRSESQAKAGATAAEGEAKQPTIEIPPPKTAGEAFATAAQAAAPQPGQPRILLTPQGTPL